MFSFEIIMQSTSKQNSRESRAVEGGEIFLINLAFSGTCTRQNTRPLLFALDGQIQKKKVNYAIKPRRAVHNLSVPGRKLTYT